MKCLAIILICLGSSYCLGSSLDCEALPTGPYHPEIWAEIKKTEAQNPVTLDPFNPATPYFERNIAEGVCNPPQIVYEPSLSFAPWFQPKKIIHGCNPVPPQCPIRWVMRFE